jgi:hypothetical protein
MTSFYNLKDEILLLCSFLSMSDHNNLLSVCMYLYKNIGFENIIPWNKLFRIKDLQYFKKISTYSGFNHIQDIIIRDMFNNINISPEFNKLKNIKNLYINLFDTTDIKSFSNLENLEILSVSITNTILPIPIETIHMDLIPLSSLNNLYSLSLYCGTILTLDSISLLTNLTELELLTPRLLSIKHIHNLIKIKYLKIKSPNILHLDPLINLINLEYLTIISKGLKNISAISNLKKLISFECETNNNLDLVPIYVLKNSIVNLDLSCYRFFNLASLKMLKKLKTLKLLSGVESVFILNLNKYDYRNKNIRSSSYYHTLDFLDVMFNINHIKTDI